MATSLPPGRLRIESGSPPVDQRGVGRVLHDQDVVLLRERDQPSKNSSDGAAPVGLFG